MSDFQTAVAAHRQGNLERASTFYRRALITHPGHGDALFLLSLILTTSDQAEPARPLAERAVLTDPVKPPYLQALIDALVLTGQIDAAAKRCHQRAVLEPDAPQPFEVISGALEASDDLAAAQRLARVVSVLRGDEPSTVMGEARLLTRQGFTEQAWRKVGDIQFRTPSRTGRYDPLFDLCSGLLLPPIPWNTDQIVESRERLSATLERVRGSPLSLTDPPGQVPQTAFYLAYQGFDDRPMMEALSDTFHAVVPAYREPLGDRIRKGIPDGRRRIVFLSGFFMQHTIWRYTQGLIRACCSRPDLEVVVVTIGALDPSDTARIKALGAAVRPIPNDFRKAVEAIRGLEADVLVHSDVGMTPISYALAATRLAPCEIVLPGHPVTTGIRSLDAYVTSAAFEPDNYAAHYTEPTINAAFWPLDYPSRSEADAVIASDAGPDLEAAPTLLCAQSIFKVHPEMDRTLASILDRLPGARLQFIDLPETFRALKDRFLQRLAAAGIDTPTRVVFLPRMSIHRYLETMSAAHVVLDTWPFSGGDSSLAALSVGAPVVTLEGAFYRGRQTAALHRRVGADCLIAGVPEAYADLVCRVATDRDFRQAAREQLLAGRAAVFGSLDGADELIEQILQAGSAGTR